jgi:predicted amidohydrolase YtcJ
VRSITASFGALALAGALAALPASTQERADVCAELVLHNGRIVTMDERGTIARAVTLRGDRIAAVATGAGIPRHDPCARLVDLRGRTVGPGLIDSHDHIVQLSLRPGHDVRDIEGAFSIAELQQALRARARTVPQGAWLTAVGGWSPLQFAEARLPTMAELDAAAPDHAVYLQSGFTGPAATNRRGRDVLTAQGVTVSPEGRIEANAPTVAAWRALKALQTDADRRRAAVDALAYAARVGLTTSVDKGGAWPADTPGAKGVAQVSPGGANEVPPFGGYEPLIALEREGRMPVRVRLFFYMQDLTPQLPFLTARLDNQFPDFGSSALRVSGIGERAHGAAAPPAVYEAAARLIARRGWAHDQHANDLADQKQIVGVWERVHASTPLTGLRWSLAHVPGIDLETLNRLKALDAGVSITGGRYLAGSAAQPGSPFRRMLQSGIRVGYGGDGGTVAPLSPWPHLYYLVTGRNSAGAAIEPADQLLTRVEALRVYTANQGWFTRDERLLGSIEAGKLADLVVLSADFLDPRAVPDAAIRRLTSVLTVVGGRIVYDAGVLTS